MKIVLFLLVFLTASCVQTVPRLPQDIEDLETPNCILPPVGFGIKKINWTAMIEGPIFKGTPWEMEARDEYLPMELPEKEGPLECWLANYNWYQGSATEERRKVTLDRSKTYIIIDIDAVIKIVRYLVENIWKKMLKSTFGLA